MAGYLGPGPPPPLGISERLLGHGTMPTDRGIFAENPYAAIPGEGGPIGIDQLTRLLTALERLLRNLVGLNVRQPSSNVPPFRADQWLYEQVVTLAPAASQIVPVTFRGQPVMPDGSRGVVATLEFWLIAADAGALVRPQDTRLSLRRNGLVVPGYQNVSPGGITLETIADAAGSDSYGSEFPGERCFVPVKLNPGDSIDLVFGPNTGAVTSDTRILIAGWTYPIEVDSDGVVGTVADRGGSELPNVR